MAVGELASDGGTSDASTLGGGGEAGLGQGPMPTMKPHEAGGAGVPSQSDAGTGMLEPADASQGGNPASCSELPGICGELEKCVAGVCMSSDTELGPVTITDALIPLVFDSKSNAYCGTVSLLAEQVLLTFQMPAPAATVRLNGNQVEGSSVVLPLANPLPPITVEVTAASGDRAVHKILLKRDPGTYLKAHNADPGDKFGQALAVHGDTAVVGALAEDGSNEGGGTDNALFDSGAVYVFVRASAGWIQQAYLKANNAERSDSFGSQVAIEGDLLAVAATEEDGGTSGAALNGGDDNTATSAGAVYLFERTGVTWQQTAYIKPAFPDASDRFGTRLAINQGRVAIASTRESGGGTGVNSGLQADNSKLESGAVYLFSKTAGGWQQDAYIKSSNSGAGDRFGSSISWQGSTLAISAYIEDSDGSGPTNETATNSGAVYIFEEENGFWEETAYLKSAAPGVDDWFGWSLHLDGDALAIGAPFESGNGTSQLDDSESQSGAAYIFARGSEGWAQAAYIKAPQVTAGDSFGGSVSLSGGRLIVAAAGEDSGGAGVNGPLDQNERLLNSGAIFSFNFIEQTWSPSAFVKPFNPGEQDHFGYMSVSGERVAVGASLEDGSTPGINGKDNDAAQDSGAVYVW